MKAILSILLLCIILPAFNQTQSAIITNSENLVGHSSFVNSNTEVVLTLDSIVLSENLELPNSSYFFDCIEQEIIYTGVNCINIHENYTSISLVGNDSLQINKSYVLLFTDTYKAISVVAQLQKKGLFSNIEVYNVPLDYNKLKSKCQQNALRGKNLDSPKEGVEISIKEEKYFIINWNNLSSTEKQQYINEYGVSVGVDQMVCVIKYDLVRLSPYYIIEPKK